MENSDNDNNRYFDINASIVFQLGESLISDPVQALVELIKNAYDADSAYAKIEIQTTKANDIKNSRYPGAKGYIRIDDNGHGMNSTEIGAGWLTISNSLKRKMKELGKKTKKERTPLGDKGLGRLGAQRLGYNLEIFTKPENEEKEYHVAFSWKDFLNKDKFGQVPVYIEELEPSREKGTTLLISDMKEPEYFNEEGALDNLKTELSKMISPYEETKGFYITAKLDGKKLELADLTAKVLKGADVQYDIDFDERELTIKGKARLSFIRPQGKKDRELFRLLVEQDRGDEFFRFLSVQKKASGINLKKSSQEGWFVEYDSSTPFESIDKLKLIYRDGEKGEKANPGRFYGSIDSFDLSKEGFADQNVFDEISEYKDYIKNLSGIRVYRNGFGIRVDKDWLGLGKQWTSATSYYGLKVENTLGYIALTAEFNNNLEETTNREGFKVSPYYDNFYKMLGVFVKFTGDVQNFLRRQWLEFKQKHQEKIAKVDSAASAEDLSEKIRKSLSKASKFKTSTKDLKIIIVKEASAARASIDKVTGKLPKNFDRLPELKSSIKSLGQHIEKAKNIIISLDEYLREISELEPIEKVLGNRITNLREQLQQFYETAGLGLTAEALSHEIHNIADRLAKYTGTIRSYLKSQSKKDPKILTFVEHVDTSISTLRKQLSHLAPSLQYVREKKEKIEIYPFCREIAYYHRNRLNDKDIDIQVTQKSEKNFYLSMNRGKLTQIFDNLFLNSIYWLREDIRTKNIRRGRININIDKPFTRFSDNGRGVDPAVETTLFEPFVTAKSKWKGRGLGLFIVRQFLDAEGCEISLLPERNKHKRFFTFEIDFSGGLYDE
ncbi:MAG: sensor histidine kinase [Candidatus Aminicenantes bacterium]|nr:sensor histidine kinase [Candidatus Aminicenantes bacterium]